MKAGDRSLTGLLDILKRGLLRSHSSGFTGSIGIVGWSTLLLENAPRKQASSVLGFGSLQIGEINASEGNVE